MCLCTQGTCVCPPHAQPGYHTLEGCFGWGGGAESIGDIGWRYQRRKELYSQETEGRPPTEQGSQRAPQILGRSGRAGG